MRLGTLCYSAQRAMALTFQKDENTEHETNLAPLRKREECTTYSASVSSYGKDVK
ncbi:unnamed protein product, partial [Bubo scandiacus]